MNLSYTPPVALKGKPGLSWLARGPWYTRCEDVEACVRGELLHRENALGIAGAPFGTLSVLISRGMLTSPGVSLVGWWVAVWTCGFSFWI